jgi:hypothetical protein
VSAPRTDRFQFRLRRLLLATTLSAAAAALVTSLQGPIALRVILTLYLILMIAYFALRAPHLFLRMTRLARERQGWLAVLLELGLVAIAVALLPLAFSILEDSLLGTHYVEDFFQTIGMHDSLGKLYEPVIDLIGRPEP